MPRVTCLIGACLCLWIAFTLCERGTDSNQFYSASQLAGTGHDGLLLLPACALVLRLPVPKALRYGALAPAVPFPYVLPMQEHGVWIVAQAAIDDVGLWLLGLLAWHGLRVFARTGRAASGPVALEDGTA